MSNTFLGLDRSGNDNNFTVTNMTLASDQMVDSPTNNFATLNSLNIGGGSLSEGNLTWGISSSTGLLCMSSVGFDIASTTHKYYWEVVLNSGECTIGIAPLELRGSDTGRAGSYSYYSSAGDKYLGASGSSYGASFTDDDIIGIAVGGGTIEFFKNNVSQGDAWTGLTGTFVPFISEVTCNITANFGQDSSFAGNKTAQGNQDSNGIGDFYYTPPTGFKALCTSNLPDVDVVPSEHFNTVTYSGTGAGVAVTGVGFQPDLVWGKKYSSPLQNHWLINAIGGAGKWLCSENTNDYGTEPAGSSFTSDGFTTNNNSLFTYTSGSYVLWNWNCPTAFSNDASATSVGTIDSDGYTNVDAGFSMVKYIGVDSQTTTVAHGLNKAPEMIIVKATSEDGRHWRVLANSDATDYQRLNEGLVTADDDNYWNDTAPTSSVFSVGDANDVNDTDCTFLAFCWHSVDGYSKVGSYTGNGVTDGPFVYTGFRPAYTLIKRMTTSNGHWTIQDNQRNPYNPVNNALLANTNDYEAINDAVYAIDYTANGFKMHPTHAGLNNNGDTYIYIAFAETPFKYANAR